MKYMIGFLAGTVFGAAIALLYAPMAGEDLRNEIRQEADARYHQVQSQVQRGLTELNTRLDKLNTDISGMITEASESIKTTSKKATEAEVE